MRNTTHHDISKTAVFEIGMDGSLPSRCRLTKTDFMIRGWREKRERSRGQ